MTDVVMSAALSFVVDNKPMMMIMMMKINAAE